MPSGTPFATGHTPVAKTAGGATPRPIRVAVCDDSLVVRGALGRILRASPDIVLAGQARDGTQAVSLVEAHLSADPVEVVVLDVDMPVMDGLAALPRLLTLDRRLKVVMASTLTRRGAATTLQALRLGAADYVSKPDTAGVSGSAQFAAELVAKIRGLGRMRRHALLAPAIAGVPIGRPPSAPGWRPHAGTRPRLLAVGSSTGGPQALLSLFRALGPRLRVPVVLTQHMPPAFVPLFAEQIAQMGGLSCAVARDGEALQPHHIHLAPGDRHLLVRADGGGVLRAVLSDAPPEHFCRPAVDPMLRSAAEACGAGGVLAVILTGMGRDGLAGTAAVVERGGDVLVQDEASSVVWGMPGAVAAAGLCRDILPIGAIPAAILASIGP